MKKNARALAGLPPVIILVGLGCTIFLFSLRDHPQEEWHDVSFDQLKAASLDSITTLPVYPDELARLDGSQVSIRGVMAPYSDDGDFHRFLLFPEGIGLEPALQEMIVVEKVAHEDSSFFTLEPVKVRGRFELADETSDHQAHRNGFFFAIDQAVVEPAQAPDH